jgi:hypothetical protein
MSALVPATLTGVLVAHQGGWDEILFVAVPIAVFAALLALANRRAAREQAADDQQREPPTDA